MASAEDGAAGAAWVRIDAPSGPSPSPRSGATAVVLGNHVYLLGGLAGGDVSPEMWSADLQPRGESPAAAQAASTSRAHHQPRRPLHVALCVSPY